MLKALQPSSVLSVWKTIFWDHCVNIMVLRCSISQSAPSQPQPHPLMFLLPSSLVTHCSSFSTRALFPCYSTFFSFLPESNSFSAFFSSFSPKLSGLGMVVVAVGAAITLPQTLVQCIYTLTPSWRPKAAAALIETNGEITQAAVLNNSLHSHLSGSMLPQ